MPFPYNTDSVTRRAQYQHWYQMRGVPRSPWPSGHAYKALMDENAAYFTANPTLLYDIVQNGVPGKNLDLPGIYGTADWDKLVNLAAAWRWTAVNASPFKSANFDALDGTDYGVNETDLIVEFTNDVVALIRAGVPAISGYYSARAAIPTAILTIMGYSRHSKPPTISLSDGVVVELATAYNASGLPFSEVVAGWKAKSPNPLSLYYYISLITWAQNKPGNNDKTVFNKMTDAFDPDSTFSTEYGANWMTTCVGVNMFLKHGMYGGGTAAGAWEDSMNDIVDSLFNGDVAVKNLYRLWSKTYTTFNNYVLRQSFDLINSMQAGTYKFAFQQYITFIGRVYHIEQTLNRVFNWGTAPYNADMVPLIKDVNAWNLALRMKGYMQNWSWMYYWGRSHLDSAYTDLRFEKDPLSGPQVRPDWFLNPYEPTLTNWQEEYDRVVAKTVRDSNLDDPSTLVVTGLPVVATGTNAAKRTHFVGNATLLRYYGPGTLSFVGVDANHADYDEVYSTVGPHDVEVRRGGYTVSYSTGYLFTNSFNATGCGGADLGRRYIWIQPSAAGNVKMTSSVIATFFDEAGQYQLYADLNANPAPTNLGPGVVALQEYESVSRGDLVLGNVNPWISDDPEVHMAPEALFKAEYIGYMEVTLG